MKKLMILLLFVCVLVGCDSEIPITQADERIDPPIIESKMSYSIDSIHEFPIEIFQSVYVESKDTVNAFKVKYSVFDPKAIETFEVKNHSTSSSEFVRDTYYLNDYTLKEAFKLTTNKSFYYFENCRVKDYQNDLSKGFIDDLNRLEQNSLSIETFTHTYGTHVICSYQTGYQFGYQLTVSNANITHSLFATVKDTVLKAFPMVLPYQDVIYLDIASKSSIDLTIETNSNKTTLEDLLNEYNGDLDEPNYKMLDYENLMPLYDLIGLNKDEYPNAYNRLKMWYSEKYSN
ncbi:MAG: MAC/perforin domain-containing protein [Acholeplasma sp.]|nr:MAC/perforin domain-containing protein [Acholeplasma sp.]